MNLLEQFSLAWQALARTAAGVRRARLWPPLLVLGVTQLGVVGLLWWFAHPAVSWFMAPLLRRVAGEEALRYPNPFRLMPALYAQADVVLGALLGSIMIGAATALFAAYFRGVRTDPAAAFGLARRRAGALVLVNLPFNLLVVALSFGLEWWVAQRGSGVMVRRLATLVILGGSVLLQALFFYLTAVVVLEGKGVLASLAALPRTWARGFWAALLLGALLLLPLLPIQFLSGRSGLLVDRGTPELVGWLVVAQVIVELLLWFLLAGSATLVYLSAVAEPNSEVAA